MLVLKRRLDQVLKIGPDVEVKIVKIESGAVTLGIVAPAAWKISREPQSDGADTNAEPPNR
jgi:carbon storage regulator CsrA